jgi:hypothetical protein
MRIFGICVLVLGLFVLRSAYKTYQDDPDVLTQPEPQEDNPNAPEAIRAHYHERHQSRIILQVEILAGGVFVLGGAAVATIRRG